MPKLFKILIDGFCTGLLLQLAIGPVFFFLINLSLQRTIFDGLTAVAAVTIVDYLYIMLAILGIGKLLEHVRIKKLIGITSAAVLLGFGLIMIFSSFHITKMTVTGYQELSNLPNSFFSAFILTLSNPLTIVFWTSIFTAKAIERNFKKAQLFYFGFSTGFATIFFLGSSVVIVTFFKASIQPIAVLVLNAVVGSILVIYAALRLRKTIG
jgi:threonine/homoserine/homoserine lactone efflux protein